GNTYRYTSRMYPSNPLAAYALLQLASCEHRQGMTPSAISTLRGMLARYPDSEYADKGQFSLAWMYFQSKDYEVAITEFEKLIRMYPKSPLVPQAAYSIADCYYNTGKYPQAEEGYRRVLTDYPASALVSDALDGLAQTLRLQGRENEAARVKDEWLASHPKSNAADAVVFANLRDLASQGDATRTIPALQGFISTHPDSPLLQEAYLLLGMAFRDNDDLDDAENTLRETVRINPGSEFAVQARLELIETAAAQQDRSKALAISEDLLSDPAARSVRSRIHYRRGLIWKADKNYPTARREFESARKAQPQDRHAALAAIELAVLSAEEGDLETGISQLRAIASSRVDAVGAEAQYRIGVLLGEAGRREEAREALLRVGYVFADAATWNARALILLGRNAEADGDVPTARGHFEKVLREYAGTDEAKEAQRRLEMLK
ncbi:MAG: tetratricopeptide repeat protein, partial [Bacteroidetes bacterium]|nr:tetratricopeptide repeat protein [Bacteroidota bacterium]